MTETKIESEIESNDTNDIQEIQKLKAKLNQLENKIKKPKREYKECECEICHKIFKNPYTLKTHMNTIHNENRATFNCPHCGKTLKSKYYLQKHIRVVHADEEKMNERNVSFEVIETN